MDDISDIGEENVNVFFVFVCVELLVREIDRQMDSRYTMHQGHSLNHVTQLYAGRYIS